jgi:hypothetical protein
MTSVPSKKLFICGFNVGIYALVSLLYLRSFLGIIYYINVRNRITSSQSTCTTHGYLRLPTRQRLEGV